jgi:hypothetical protein
MAAARRVFEAAKTFRVFYDYDKDCWPSRASEQAMREAEQAFAADDYDRAGHLAAVVLVMMRRDTAKFNADPKGWIARMRELAA